MDNDELLISMKDIFEKSIDKIEKKFDEKVEEVKTHNDVLTEHLVSQVKAVAEGHEILLKKIEDTKTELCQSINNIGRRLDNLEKDMSIVKDYVIAVDTKLNEHEVILKRVK